MTMTDPISDMLTRIRNATRVHKKTVSMPASKVKQGIASQSSNRQSHEKLENVEIKFLIDDRNNCNSKEPA